MIEKPALTVEYLDKFYDGALKTCRTHLFQSQSSKMHWKITSQYVGKKGPYEHPNEISICTKLGNPAIAIYHFQRSPKFYKELKVEHVYDYIQWLTMQLMTFWDPQRVCIWGLMTRTNGIIARLLFIYNLAVYKKSCIYMPPNAIWQFVFLSKLNLR